MLEFLNLPTDNLFLGKDLENAIINNLQQFILEPGEGYAFVARQKHVRAGDDFYIDLVFYNYILKRFVLVDLKLGKLTHQDIGQIDTYVRWYEEHKKGTGNNPTLGIILCFLISQLPIFMLLQPGFNLSLTCQPCEFLGIIAGYIF